MQLNGIQTLQTWTGFPSTPLSFKLMNFNFLLLIKTHSRRFFSIDFNDWKFFYTAKKSTSHLDLHWKLYPENSQPIPDKKHLDTNQSSHDPKKPTNTRIYIKNKPQKNRIKHTKSTAIVQVKRVNSEKRHRIGPGFSIYACKVHPKRMDLV